jgi:hypothetical protein
MVLFGSHPLPSGERVRLRLARPSDRAGLARLLSVGEVAIRRAMRGWTIVATVWDGSHERIVGFASVDGPGPFAIDPEVRDLLARALDEHAPAWSRRVA